VLWVSIPLLVMCISRSRLPLYVLPLFPAIVLATARAGVLYFAGPRAPALFRNYIIVMSALVILFKAVVGHLNVPTDSRRLYQAVIEVMPRDALCVIFESEALYGLEFYLGGHTERIHKLPGDPAKTSAGTELRQELSGHSGHTNILFVADGRQSADRLSDRLAREHLDVSKTRQLGRYSLLLVSLPAEP
jgi:4-amino-4-deoxy-L-arabinose transferase